MITLETFKIRIFSTRGAKSLLTLAAVFAFMSLPSSGQTEQRPITDFLNALPNFWTSGWADSETAHVLRIDAYGKMNTLHSLNAGTTVKGKVSVQELGDGMRKVTIHLNTKNAACWGYKLDNTMLFGYSPLESGGPASMRANAAIGDAMLQFVSNPIPTSDPIDYVTMFNRFDFASVNATIMCNGVLRTGSGSPDGTEGFAQTTQVGRFDLGTATGCGGGDGETCFPAEKVQFKPTGN